jgi:hypothetical protein
MLLLYKNFTTLQLHDKSVTRGTMQLVNPQIIKARRSDKTECLTTEHLKTSVGLCNINPIN